MKNIYDKILDLYLSDERSLKLLAEKTPYDKFNFYRGADLRGIDLSGQDLTGMNFEGADLRFSVLDNIVYDAGAFNGSILDPNQEWITDNYEYYYDDLINHPIDEILIYCSIRPNIVDLCLKALNINYTNFSSKAFISVNALRKSRSEGVIAHETAFKIFTTIKELSNNKPPNFKVYIESLMKQPFVQFLSGGMNAPFKNISKSRMKNILDMRKEIVEIHKFANINQGSDAWRSTPESLEWLLQYYRTYYKR
ncbi:pentapeptide repeat-containing protein [Sphingomonas sanguinis]|uniref:Pentapeptide repeat-containing protein n=1 Tax=Sphingomonas sanguinis TaxID=33051 RepID=A0ABU5LLF1_9SPHN|nr:pentapeptide repeat-containing protein [Sphingomonas sanguinis]MDZ7280748.1 pentapeptide repeat-containing protein [Sphingomonas sanguinis]